MTPTSSARHSRDQLVLGLAPDQRVVELRGGERRTPEGALTRHRGRHLPRPEVAGAGGAHQAARDEVVERAQRLLDRRGAVGTVQLVEVDVVGAETGEARLARGDDVVVRQRAGTTLAEADLGGDEHVVAPVADGGAEDLLRLPERVHVGGVDQVHARVEGAVDHHAGVALVDGGDRRHAGTERHRAERQLRDLEPTRAEAPPFHGFSLLDSTAAASSAPSGPITRRNRTGAPSAMVREPSAMAVQWNGNRRPPRASTSPRPRWSSNSTTRPETRLHPACRHGTILEIGSSMMPLAPEVEQVRDQRVDLALGHDGLDREAVLAEQLRHRRRLQRRAAARSRRRGRRRRR